MTKDDLPHDRAGVYRVFGNPGRGTVSLAWSHANMLTARDLPGTWNGGGNKLFCHRLAEPFIREALNTCQDDGQLGYIARLGCYNFRHQRHDPKRPLSYHAWGIALDINSGDNAPKTVPRNLRCFSPEWLALWPRGVPYNLVSAFEHVGWKWGGRWRPWCDPMHFELTR